MFLFLIWNSYQKYKHAISSLKFKRKIFVTEEKEDMNLKESSGVGWGTWVWGQEGEGTEDVIILLYWRT